MTAPPVLCWLFAAALLGCNQDYAKFVFDGGAASQGGASGGTSADGGMPGSGASSSTANVPAGISVPCGGAACDVEAGEVCCVAAATGQSPACATGCVGGEALLVCNGASDCGGQRCCLLHAPNGDYDHSACLASCGAGVDELCDPADDPPCSAGSCQSHGELAGYSVCN